MLTVKEFAKHFDMALLAQNAQKADIRQAAESAMRYEVASVNVNSYWLKFTKDLLKDSGVGASAVIGFPYGAATTETKMCELKQMVDLGASACDMVVNIGELKDKGYDYVSDEIREFMAICGDECLTKLIFEVGFLTEEEIAKLTQICCDAGVDYVETSTCSQAFPDIKHIKIMKENLRGHTKIKVSGVPRTFTLPVVLYMFDELGVGLVGTRSAGKLIEEYKEYFEKHNK